MNNTLLVFVALAVGSPQDTDATRQAIEIVRSVKGTLLFDEKSAGKPVIGLNL